MGVIYYNNTYYSNHHYQWLPLSCIVLCILWYIVNSQLPWSSNSSIHVCEGNHSDIGWHHNHGSQGQIVVCRLHKHCISYTFSNTVNVNWIVQFCLQSSVNGSISISPAKMFGHHINELTLVVHHGWCVCSEKSSAYQEKPCSIEIDNSSWALTYILIVFYEWVKLLFIADYEIQS